MCVGSMYCSINSRLVTKACHIQNGGMCQKMSHNTWTLNGALMTPRVVRRISSRLVVTLFAITIDALTQLAAFIRAQ